MTRLELYNLIDNIIPTYSVGQIKGVVTKDCCILRREMDTFSMGNSLGYWDRFTIDIYSNKSPLEVDKYVNKIKEVLLSNDIEIVNQLSGDYYDEVMKAFSTSISFRIPKTL